MNLDKQSKGRIILGDVAKLLRETNNMESREPLFITQTRNDWIDFILSENISVFYRNKMFEIHAQLSM